MKRSFISKFNIFGVLAILIVPLTGMAEEYPDELSFMEKYKLPRYMYAEGQISIVDSAGMQLSSLPFVFYWEDGEYALDIRDYGGTVLLYAKGLADTVWVYDFMHNVKLVALRNQNFGMTAGIPFSPKDILMMFNIYPQGFAKDISSVSSDEDYIYAKSMDASTFVFGKESEVLERIDKRGYKLRFSDYLHKKKTVIPQKIHYNRGFLLQQSTDTHVDLVKIEFKRMKKNNPLDATVPESLGRNFDSRPESE